MFNFVVLLENNSLYFEGRSKFGVDMGTCNLQQSTISMDKYGKLKDIVAGWSHFLFVTKIEQSFSIYGFGRIDFSQFCSNSELENYADDNCNRKNYMNSSSKAPPSTFKYITEPQYIISNLKTLPTVFCGSENSLIIVDGTAFVCGWNEHGTCGLCPKSFPIVNQLTEIMHNVILIGGGYASTFLGTDTN